MNTQSLLPISGQNASLTMSSREIARLCEKEHRNVLRDIENLNQTYAEMGLLKIEQGYFTHPSTGSQRHREFLLTREQCIDLVTGYRADVRIRINRRWQELENQQKSTALSRKDLALMVIQAEEENERLQLENKQQSIQIESMNSYFRNGISPFEFVKGLNGVNSLKVGEFLVGKNWLYQDGDRKRVKSYARDQYLTEQVDEIAQHGREPFLAYKPVLLKKGAAKLYEWYTQSKLPMKASWNGEFTQDKAVGL